MCKPGQRGSLSIRVGLNVEAIRLAGGVTKAELRRRLGWKAKNHLDLIEGGRISVRIDTLEKLAEALGVDPGTLLQKPLEE